MVEARRPARVVICHAPEDGELRGRLEGHLIALVRSGVITVWHGEQVPAGEDGSRAAEAEIQRADVVLLLVSASFLQSDECYLVQMPHAMRRHAGGEALVIPVLLRPALWEEAPFRDLVCLPGNGLPVTLWRDADEALREIAMGIREAAFARSRGEPFTVPALPAKAPAPSEERRVDAAVPAQVVVQEPTQVLAMVAISSSGGLRALLRVDDVYRPIKPEDVRSSNFKLDFPVDALGRRQPATVTVTLESPDFKPWFTFKKIQVPPGGDSAVCTLFVTPVRAGTLPLEMEVRVGDVTVWSLRLRTNAADAGATREPSYVLASLPLSTVSAEPKRESLESRGAGDSRPHSVLYSLESDRLLDLGVRSPSARPLAPTGRAPSEEEPGRVWAGAAGWQSITGSEKEGGLDRKRKLAGFLVSLDGALAGTFWPLREGRNVIGRAPAKYGVHVQILHAGVSRVHALIECRGDRVTVQDLGSVGGTAVHGDKLDRQVAVPIEDRDIVRFAEQTMMILLVKAPPELAGAERVTGRR